MSSKEDVSACITPDGGLYSLGWYLSWRVGAESATLDGMFTAEDLRAIADHMEAPLSSREKVA